MIIEIMKDTFPTEHFVLFDQIKSSLDPQTFSLHDLQLNEPSETLNAYDVCAFYADYLEYRVQTFQQNRVLLMSEDYYALSWLRKLWLLFHPLLTFFESFTPVWLTFFLTHEMLKTKLELLFSHDLDEFILISRYVELCQENKLIPSIKDSDELADALHQALYQCLLTWRDTDLTLEAQFKPAFMRILEIKNLD